jgi:hypothetical protein
LIAAHDADTQAPAPSTLPPAALIPGRLIAATLTLNPLWGRPRAWRVLSIISPVLLLVLLSLVLPRRLLSLVLLTLVLLGRLLVLV